MLCNIAVSVIALFLLALVACIVGVFIGAVGVGGVLLIPALNTLGGLSVHASSATALCTFFFTGLFGTFLFQRRGSIDWRIALPVCASALVFSFVGAMVNSMLQARSLAIVIATIIVIVGIYILLPTKQNIQPLVGANSPWQRPLLLAVGAVAGFGSGLSGAGGPVFSVPIMLLLGFQPLVAIGVSQVLQITSAASGTLANFHYGSIEFVTAGWVTVVELLGVMVGVRAAHVANVRQLRVAAALLCVVVGSAMFLRGV